ncbi:MAG: DMT family transporter [Anaerolineae bacterium]|nr:DMT family transporter [Anaerolineae bacterium]
MSTRLQIERRATYVYGIGMVNIATLTWAINMTLGRWLRDDIGPLTLSAFRFSTAGVILTYLLHRNSAEHKECRHIGHTQFALLAAMALTGVILFAPALYLGLHFTTAVNATLISSLSPLITGVLATLLIREPMSWRQLAGAGVGLAGVVTLIYGGSLSELHLNPGDLMMLGTAVLWALYSVLGRLLMRQYSPLFVTTLSTLLGLPVLWVAAAWEQHVLPPHITLRLIPALLYIGVFPSVVGFLAWNAGVNLLGPSGAMVFYNTLPLYGAVIACLFLSEPLGLNHLLGALLIVGGGVWAAWKPSHVR